MISMTLEIFLCVLALPVLVYLFNRLRRVVRRVGSKERPGHVLLFTQLLVVGGLERLVLTLGRALQQTGRWKVYIFSHDSDENAESYTDKTLIGEFLKDGMEVDALKKGAGISFPVIFRLVRNVYVNDIDVIHSHDMGTLVYAVLAKLFSLGRVRIVHTQHSFVHINRHKRYVLYEKLFTFFVDRLTVVNSSLIEPYGKIGIGADRIHVVNNGVSFADAPLGPQEKLNMRTSLIASLRESEKKSIQAYKTDHWLLYLARLHSVKGQREAARVWSNLTPEFRKKSILTIVGPEAEEGERAQVLKAFEQAPDRERVIFIDGTKAPQDWISASDLYLSFSKFEGMPLGPMEAIGSGLPAVLSSIDGHRFLEAVTGQYRLESPHEGALLIERVFKDPTFATSDYYSALWNKSEWIRKQYSPGAMADRYAQLYGD